MVITTDNLVKIYNTRHVVDGVSISVEQGSVVGLLGPNGAGKTTTFYMIVGIEKPDAGTVMLDGKDISAMPMYQRARAGIGYLPQEASIFSKMTVEDNIMAILETTDLNASEREAKMNALLDEFRLNHVRSCPVASSSASPLPVRWLPTRPSFCWTNRLPVSTLLP